MIYGAREHEQCLFRIQWTRHCCRARGRPDVSVQRNTMIQWHNYIEKGTQLHWKKSQSYIEKSHTMTQLHWKKAHNDIKQAFSSLRVAPWCSAIIYQIGHSEGGWVGRCWYDLTSSHTCSGILDNILNANITLLGANWCRSIIDPSVIGFCCPPFYHHLISVMGSTGSLQRLIKSRRGRRGWPNQWYTTNIIFY